MSVQISTLSNGLRVATQVMPGLQTASISLMADCGARFETAENNGAAHMLEHMVFKGTRLRSARKIAEDIEAVGGVLNAYTSRDQTNFYARVLGEDVGLGVEMVSDLITSALLTPEDLLKEKEVVLQELGTAMDTPDDIIFDELQNCAFPQQPLGQMILGTPASIESMTPQKLHDYLRTHYLAGSMVLCVAGQCDHTQVTDWAEKYLGHLPAGVRPVPQVARYRGGIYFESRELEQHHIAMALPAASVHDEQHYAQMLFSTVLGGSMSSRLFQDIREERGLAYSVYSYLTPYTDSGLLSIYLGTAENHAEEAANLAVENLHAAAAHVTDEELRRAKAQAKASVFMGLESCSAQAENIARQILLFDRVISPQEIVAKIDACSAEDVAASGRAILSGGDFALATIGNDEVVDAQTFASVRA